MLCAIWYHLYNLKNVNNAHGGVLLLAEAYNFTKSNTTPWAFFKFLKLCTWHQIAQNILKSYKSGYFTTYTTLRELSGLKQFLGTQSPLKVMKKAFISP